MRTRPKLLLLLSLSAITQLGLALSADGDKPCHINSDSATFHHQNNTVEFSGHVTSQQGSSQSWSDYAKAYGDKTGRIQKILLTGKPAKYKTLNDNDTAPLVVTANTIIDYINKNVIYLHGHAMVHHGADSIEGDRIWYNRVTGTIKSLATKNQRTKTVFTPQNKKEKK